MDTYRFERLITVENPEDRAAADALVNRVFGPGRYVKTAERLREGNTPLADLCFVMRLSPAVNAEGVAGSVRLWPVRVYDDAHNIKGELAFLGPIAVDPEHQSHGIGRTLTEVAIKAAFDRGVTGILLVGTPSYFERFGFATAQGLSLPGPVDNRRVMVLYNPAHTGDLFHGAVGI